MDSNIFINEYKRIFTWNIHEKYLYYLTKTPCIFYLPIKRSKEEGYRGKSGNFLWSDNVIEIEADEVKNIQFDCILFQSKKNYLEDQFQIFSEDQRELPKIYLELEIPAVSTAFPRFVYNEPEKSIFRVFPFSKSIDDNQISSTRIIPHGVIIPEKIKYSGKLNKGIVVIKDLLTEQNILAVNILKKVSEVVPLDIIGNGSNDIQGGLGDNEEWGQLISQYRFYFNLNWDTSDELSVCEAMMMGMPIIGLSPIERTDLLKNGISGYIHSNIDYLTEKMKLLIQNPDEAQILSEGSRIEAEKKYNITRFSREWRSTFDNVIKKYKQKLIDNINV